MRRAEDSIRPNFAASQAKLAGWQAWQARLARQAGRVGDRDPRKVDDVVAGTSFRVVEDRRLCQ